MRNIKLFNCRFGNFVIYFAIYSLVGWYIETIYAFLLQGKFINRGLLIGPFCPIYGFGALILIIFLKPVKHNMLLTFSGSIVLTSLLEYITSFLLELTFSQSLWDYSGEPFNLSGRICLRNSIFWGIASLIFIYVLHPAIRLGVYRIPKVIKAAAAYFIVFYLLFDTITVILSLTGIEPDISVFCKMPESIYSDFEHIRGVIVK